MKKRQVFKILLIPATAFAFLLIFSAPFEISEASIIDELKQKIDTKGQEIKEIEEEIAKYQEELKKLGNESNTLQNAIATLETSKKKLETDIRLTESKIAETSLTLEELGMEISESQEKIEKSSQAVAETVRKIDEASQRSLIEAFLSYENLADFWGEVESLERFQKVIRDNIKELTQSKEILEEQKIKSEEKVSELKGFQAELSNQKIVVESNKQEKDQLLTATKNTESEYKRILEENIARKEAFEKELFEFESQLQIAIDPSSIPSASNGILKWPLDNIFITQKFGKTVDSQQLYVSGTHNGVDFRAPTGTKVKSALDGVVKTVANTDDVPGCYSFGRWILITHNNGLSTLYAHLSVASVSEGQQVKKGETIGYSGGLPGTSGAGYSTGPHLHFGVYASQGIQPKAYVSNTPCNGAMMPLADQKAYLDPLVYLPTL